MITAAEKDQYKVTFDQKENYFLKIIVKL